MAHGLAHALMTEVAIDCGYPASALKERVYALPRGPGEPIRCGILIYTASAGNQGTLGGLVEVTRRFGKVLTSALDRLRLCSGDPVCADHEPAAATDDRALHGAACHGCLLVAETSCEARNHFLDRALVVETVGTAPISRNGQQVKSIVPYFGFAIEVRISAKSPSNQSARGVGRCACVC